MGALNLDNSYYFISLCSQSAEHWLNQRVLRDTILFYNSSKFITLNNLFLCLISCRLLKRPSEVCMMQFALFVIWYVFHINSDYNSPVSTLFLYAVLLLVIWHVFLLIAIKCYLNSYSLLFILIIINEFSSFFLNLSSLRICILLLSVVINRSPTISVWIYAAVPRYFLYIPIWYFWGI
jgi:hypothetical protein